MDKIKIENLEVFAKHGVFPEENVLGQKFVISAVFYLQLYTAGHSDRLEDSLHYGEACHFIKEFTEKNTYKLLESLSERMAYSLFEKYPQIIQLDLEIKKPWAPVGVHLENVAVEITRKRHNVFIAMGSNMGDKKAYLDMAVKKVEELPGCRVINVADYILTKPYGGIEQDDFLNSVMEIETIMPADMLLEKLHEIENLAQRKRTQRWGPRTLDLDIIFYDDEIISSPDLTIPHEEMQKRDFVLRPMMQIAPYKRHPIYGKTIKELWNELYVK